MYRNRNNPNKCCSCIKFIATPLAFASYTTVIVIVNGNNMRVERSCWVVEGKSLCFNNNTKQRWSELTSGQITDDNAAFGLQIRVRTQRGGVMPDLPAKVLFSFDKLRGHVRGHFYTSIRASRRVHGGANVATFFKISPL